MERDILNRKITKKNGEKVPIRTLKLQEQLKYEIADELGLFEKIEKRGFYGKYKGSLLEKDYYIDCKINEEYSHTVKE